MPEGQQGYAQAQGFYQGELAQPSVYPGERIAPQNALQGGAFQQAGETLRNPQATQAASGEMNRTLSGDWLSGQGAQQAARGLAQPIFERFENQTMPGIRDQAQMATGGMGGSRRTVANQNAVQELGYNIGQGAIAPVYNQERDRMTRQAIEGSAGITNQNIATTGALANMGNQQQKLRQAELEAQQMPFEEGLARQAASADALTAMATTGPGGSTAAYNPSVMRMILGGGKA